MWKVIGYWIYWVAIPGSTVDTESECLASPDAPETCISMPQNDRVLVEPLDPKHIQELAKYGINITAHKHLGATVHGLDLRKKPDESVLKILQLEMAKRGFLAFKDQGLLAGDEQVKASEYWGGRKIHSTHGVHPKAPNEHIFRLANDPSHQHGTNGVGPQWHNDGSFERGVFSHAGYHIIKVPENGGATLFVHQGAAYDNLDEETRKAWDRYVSVNSNSGVMHPVVHKHPISGRKSVWLHLGMTGAVFEVSPGADWQTKKGLRLLEKDEMTNLFHTYNDLLNAGLPRHQEKKHRTAKGAGRNRRQKGTPPYAVAYAYEQGDCVFIDNMAVAHRAAPESHFTSDKQGLRIMHRTTVKAMVDFDPGFGLPPVANVHGGNPLGQGVWSGGGLGFRWDENIRMQN